MVKTMIGGIDVQKYTTRYSCQCPPVNGNNSFYDTNGEYVADKKGDEVLLNLTLEEVPTPISVKLAAALEAESVVVDYTTPVPKQDRFVKTSYNAECDDADPDTLDYDITDGIIWTIQLSLRSAGIKPLSGGL